jgi:probable F420-dependent oxidoreductase
MRFTLTYPLLHHPSPPELSTGGAVREVAQAAEEAGFDALAFTEHPMPSSRWLEAGGHDALDPFIALTWAAAATERLRLLTNITVVAYRNPFLLAKTVATLDALSGGRVILGAAAGYLKSEFRALGVDFEERNELFDEALEVLAMTWTGEPVTYTGRHFSADGNQLVPRPVQQPPPIWIGGNSTVARRRAAASAQGWMPFANPPQANRVVRTPSIWTADDLAPLLDEMAGWARDAGRGPLDVHFGAGGGGTPGADDFDADDHRRKVEALGAIGVTWVGAGTVGDDLASVLAGIEIYGREVIAAFR